MDTFDAGDTTVLSRMPSMRAAPPASFALEIATPRTVTAVQAGVGSIRSFEPQDIPRVCELFLKTFRKGKAQRIDDLAAAIHATYLTSPAYGPDIGSIVHLDGGGRINGFLGIINIGMQIGDRPIRAGVLSAFMADGPAADPTIGVRLSRALSSRACDIIFTDTANRTSLDISRAMRFDALPLHSLEWMKTLRPAGTAGHLLSRKFPMLDGWIRPVARAVDAGLPAIRAAEIDLRTIEGTVDRPMETSDFVAEAPGFVSGYALRPTWGADELAWVMSQAQMRTRNGPLQIRQVLDRGGRRIGLYLLHARPGAVAFALHVLARPGRSDMVIGNLMARARDTGAVAISGSASPEVVQGLLRQRGVFYRGGMNTIVRSKDHEIAKALKNGDFALGGLVGETWARIFADDFS